MNTIISFVLGCLFLGSAVLLKNFQSVSVKEVKRRARRGDKLANALYRTVAYGGTLKIFMWILIGLFGALFYWHIASYLNGFAVVIIITISIWYVFGWALQVQSTMTGRYVARYAAIILQPVLDRLQPVLRPIASFFEDSAGRRFHTGLYEKSDLIELIDQQKVQIDNRITKEELQIARHALVFGEKQVGDIMTPRKVIKHVNFNESVGPVLLDELHASGFSRFPVYEGKEDNIVGVLYLKDLIKAKSGGLIKNVMHKKVFYVHEDSSLHSLLSAMLSSHSHVFIVVNNFEEIVGLVSMEDVLEAIIGKKIVDEFDQHDDLRAVAAQEANKERKNNETLLELTEVKPKER